MTAEPPEGPAMDEVLSAIADEDARALLRALDRPKSAGTLAEEVKAPLSSVYRLLDRLSAASLLEERTAVRPDGHHTTKYAPNFSTIHVRLREDRSLELAVERGTLRTPNEPPSP